MRMPGRLADKVGQYISLNQEVFDLDLRPAEFTYRTLLAVAVFRDLRQLQADAAFFRGRTANAFLDRRGHRIGVCQHRPRHQRHPDDGQSAGTEADQKTAPLRILGGFDLGHVRFSCFRDFGFPSEPGAA